MKKVGADLDSPKYFHQSDYDASQWDDIKYTFAQLASLLSMRMTIYNGLFCHYKFYDCPALSSDNGFL